VQSRDRRRALALITGLAIFSGTASAVVHATHLPAGWAAALCFGAVIAAALLISWGAEAAQFFVSQGLAVAVIALLQVVPEFMVEAVIAWDAGQTGHVDLVFANASGSNRLLTGFGWPLIFFVTDFYHRKKHGKRLEALSLRPENMIEVAALLAASAWYLVVIARGQLSTLDTVVLGGFFVSYLWALNRLPSEKEEAMDDLLAPPRALATLKPARTRNFAIGTVLVVCGLVMWAVADPFLDAMREVAFAAGISQFAFVQWVAPFLTEFPEKVTAIYWSRTVKLAPMALLNMVSSTVNQYTALVAMIPAAYAASVGRAFAPVTMDPLHKTELFLSFATTLYGCACLMKLRFTRGNALVMLALFVFQFIYKGPIGVPVLDGDLLTLRPENAHVVVAFGYLALAAVELLVRRRENRFWQGLREAWRQMRRP
jgi:cation:H+ antiporter